MSPAVTKITRYLLAAAGLLLLSACAGVATKRPIDSSDPTLRDLHTKICHRPADFKDQVIGNGQCVDFIRACAQTPFTQRWRPGPALYAQQGNQIEALRHQGLVPGTIIATFKDNRYPNVRGYHAAVYVSHDQHGILVWDQFKGKRVGKRLIRVRTDNAYPSNTAQRYHMVVLD